MAAGIVHAGIKAEAPVNIKSQTLKINNDNGEATYSGNVQVEQGTRKLYSDKLIIKRDSNNKISEIIANGNPASFSDKPGNFGHAKVIKYYPQLDQVALLQDASITQNGDTISGPSLNYDFKIAKLSGTSVSDARPTFVLKTKKDPQ